MYLYRFHITYITMHIITQFKLFYVFFSFLNNFNFMYKTLFFSYFRNEIRLNCVFFLMNCEFNACCERCCAVMCCIRKLVTRLGWVDIWLWKKLEGGKKLQQPVISLWVWSGCLSDFLPVYAENRQSNSILPRDTWCFIGEMLMAEIEH